MRLSAALTRSTGESRPAAISSDTTCACNSAGSVLRDGIASSRKRRSGQHTPGRAAVVNRAAVLLGRIAPRVPAVPMQKNQLTFSIYRLEHNTNNRPTGGRYGGRQ